MGEQAVDVHPFLHLGLRDRPRAFPTPLGERIDKDKLCLSTETAWAEEICGLVKKGRALPTSLCLLNYTIQVLFFFFPSCFFFFLTDSQY